MAYGPPIPLERVGPPAPTRQPVPPDLPPAPKATRVRGVAVPLVAAAIVAGVGYPLTALAVSQAGRLSAALSSLSGDEGGTGPAVTGAPIRRARVSGAVDYEGPVTPVGCESGVPSIMLFQIGTDQYDIQLGLNSETRAGSYPVGGTTFVQIKRQTGRFVIWSSWTRPNAKGLVRVGADRSVSASFSGLESDGDGTVEGSVEVTCG